MSDIKLITETVCQLADLTGGVEKCLFHIAIGSIRLAYGQDVGMKFLDSIPENWLSFGSTKIITHLLTADLRTLCFKLALEMQFAINTTNFSQNQ